jgi:hypothetical protein
MNFSDVKFYPSLILIIIGSILSYQKRKIDIIKRLLKTLIDIL